MDKTEILSGLKKDVKRLSIRRASQRGNQECARSEGRSRRENARQGREVDPANGVPGCRKRPLKDRGRKTRRQASDISGRYRVGNLMEKSVSGEVKRRLFALAQGRGRGGGKGGEAMEAKKNRGKAQRFTYLSPWGYRQRLR